MEKILDVLLLKGLETAFDVFVTPDMFGAEGNVSVSHLLVLVFLNLSNVSLTYTGVSSLPARNPCDNFHCEEYSHCVVEELAPKCTCNRGCSRTPGGACKR